MIGLLDCNNFFVSCERLFRPDLANRPVVVLSSNDGCVVARSQEVKDMGVPMGIPYFKVKEEFAKAGVVSFSSNFTLYRDISARVMAVLAEEVGQIEKYSIDESFFSVSAGVTRSELEQIRQNVIKKTGIPVSVGVAKTKTIAKYANSLAKKNTGVDICTGNDWFVATKELKCGAIWGIGSGLTKRLKDSGVDTVSDLLALAPGVVQERYGVVGGRLASELSEVSVYKIGSSDNRAAQSVTSSRSFAEATGSIADLEAAVAKHTAICASKLRSSKLSACSLQVYIGASRYGDFSHRSGSARVELDRPTADTIELTKTALETLQKIFDAEVPYKKAGVVLGDLLPEEYIQPVLFAENASEQESVLGDLTDLLNHKYGAQTVRLAVERVDAGLTKSEKRSPSYTTMWKDIPKIKAK